jgi:anaerobic dimethyl sulfoxide reductase subunit C
MRRHEWPLVVFTILGQTAAGLTLFLLVPLYFLPELTLARDLRPMRLAVDLAVLGLIGGAALLSLFHLKHPRRAVRALANSGASWLSREILALVLFGGATAGLAALAWKAPASPAAITLAVLVAAEAVAFVYSMARLYTQPAVPDWNSPATAIAFFATPIVLGSMLAALAARGEIPHLTGLVGSPTAAILQKSALAAAGAVLLAAFLYSPRFGLRVKRETPRAYAPNPRFVPIFAARIVLLALAVSLWGLATLRPGASAGPAWTGFAAAAMSEIIGRWLFYALPDEL